MNRTTNYSQVAPNSINDFHFFVRSIPEETSASDGRGGLVTITHMEDCRYLTKETTHQDINLKVGFGFGLNSYITPSYTHQLIPLLSSYEENSTLETEIVTKFERIDKVLKVFIKQTDKVILVKVFIEMATYDYELMEKILNEAEYPIKDFFRDRLIDFEYIPSGKDAENLTNEQQMKLIFNRLISFFDCSYGSWMSYTEPREKYPKVTVWPIM